jgi:hypothetical protein
MSDEDTTWYWDLRRGRPVRASERGPADDVLGPYASRAEAEAWKERVEQRNEAWDDADEEWEGRRERDGTHGDRPQDRE